jgi:hypothetical protein
MELHDNNLFTTSGTVSAVVQGKYSYIKFWQRYEFKGDSRSRLFTAWFDRLPDGIQETDRVTISGDLGAKVNEYTKPANLVLGTGPETRQIVEWSLNNCSLIAHEPKVQAPVATSPASTEDVPF